jgi:hypothetical protein
MNTSGKIETSAMKMHIINTYSWTATVMACLHGWHDKNMAINCPLTDNIT